MGRIFGTKTQSTLKKFLDTFLMWTQANWLLSNYTYMENIHIGRWLIFPTKPWEVTFFFWKSTGSSTTWMEICYTFITSIVCWRIWPNSLSIQIEILWIFPKVRFKNTIFKFGKYITFKIILITQPSPSIILVTWVFFQTSDFQIHLHMYNV